MVTSYLIPESNQSGLNGNIVPASLKEKSMEELLKMKKEKEAAIEQDEKLVLENNVSAKAKARRKTFLRFDVEDLTHINAEIESRKKTAPAPAKSPEPAPVAPPATNPIVPAPVAPPAINPIVPAQVMPTDTNTQAGGNTNTQAGGNTNTQAGQNHLAPTTPTTDNEGEPKGGFFTPTNILLMLLVVGGGIFFMTRKGK